jgi:hypothetical protein
MRLALTFALLLVAPPVFAQPTSNAVAAEELFHQGRALLQQNDLAAACEKFAASQKLDPAVGTLFSLGECYERRELLASAWFTYRAAVALAIQRADARQVLAQTRADALEPRLARLRVVLEDTRGVTTVLVDGNQLVLEALETPLPVDPGAHRVEADGERSWSQQVDVPGNGANVVVRVPSLAAPVAAPPVAAWKRPVAIGLLEAGGVATGVGLIAGMQAIVKGRDANAECPALSCANQAAVQENDTAKTFATVATVMIPVGLAVAAVGGVLLATSGPSIEASAGPTSAQARVQWVW